MKNVDMRKAVFTVKNIVTKSMPILYVIRDDDDEWQFLTGEDVSMADMMMVTVRDIIDIDPSIVMLELSVGYEAFKAIPTEEWKIQKLM